MPRIRRLLTPLAVPALAAAAMAPAAGASTTQVAIFQDDGGLAGNPAATLDTIRSLGATEVRVFIPWGTVAPSSKPSNEADPASYSAANWAKYDVIDRLAKADGITVLFDIVNPAPKWGQAGGDPSHDPHFTGSWKPNPSDFGQFIRAVGTRYSGSYKPSGQTTPLPRVSNWSVWNEPNYGPSLNPQSASSTVLYSTGIYRGLLNAAWSGLHATGHGSDTILFGEVAPHGYSNGGRSSGIAPLAWLRGLYCLGSNMKPLTGSLATQNGCPSSKSAFRSQNPALFSASGFAAHPYAQGTPPNKSLVVKGQDDADFADLGAIGKLTSLLDKANSAYGSSKKFPIWSTEYGFQTNPPEHPNPSQHIYPVSLATAAEYMNWAEYISYKNSRIRSYDQYLLLDPPGANGSNFASGLYFANGKPKPSLDAYRLPLFMPTTSAGHASSLEVWGAIRPAHFALTSGSSGKQTAQLQFEPKSGGSFSTLTTVSASSNGGYFDIHQQFSQSGTVRLAWTDQNGTVQYSRSITVTV